MKKRSVNFTVKWDGAWLELFKKGEIDSVVGFCNSDFEKVFGKLIEEDEECDVTITIERTSPIRKTED